MDTLASSSRCKHKAFAKTDGSHFEAETDILKTAGSLACAEDDLCPINKECEGIQSDLVSSKENIHVYVRVRPFLEKVFCV